ncbi:hypothetical protein M0812_05213 [Anaeramoeba flamelloides]|uniref:BTB domain-containing protein n=1 Tax=Anaeramoeba flamelloides TaxID=1746091 RepID=A0AAV8A4D2_9EUKA|nr:hypothetical protein M0812_05213 [Anaeramoeba flamelloides]
MSNIKSLGDINFINSEQSYETLETIKTFPEEVTKIVDVADNDNTIVFLSSEGKLYQSTKKNYHIKLKAIENLPPMKSIASGYYHFLAISNEEKPKVYGWGDNEYKQLGFEFNNDRVQKPTLIEPLKDQNIEQICCGGHCSFFLNKTTNVLFGCGYTKNGMLGKPEITGDTADLQKLHENVATVFGGHSDHTLMMKTDGKLYGFGFNHSGEVGLGHKDHALTPTQIKLEFPVEDISKIRLAYRLTSILTNDGKLYVTGTTQMTGFGSDLTKFQQYPQFKNNNTIIQDVNCGYDLFAILTQDNEIWVQGKFNDSNSKEDDEEEDEEEELYIHKFILAARSGLFLNMFQNIEENLHKVKDYSGKSLETIELLISFLYTDELPITADTDQEFIKEEFEDIVEYYQLNPTIPMMDIFEKYSKI